MKRTRKGTKAMTEPSSVSLPGPTGPLLPEQQIKAALARSARDWMEIYIEVLMETVKKIIAQQPAIEGKVMEDFRGETRPRLLRIAREFDAAGFILTDDVDVEGPQPGPGGQPLWPDTTNPVVVFSTAEGKHLAFRGVDAPSALGFVQFWLQHSELVKGHKPRTRIIQPGSAEAVSYLNAKRSELGDV